MQKEIYTKKQKYLMKDCTFEPSLLLTSDYNELLQTQRESDRDHSPAEKRLIKWGTERESKIKKKQLQIQSEIDSSKPYTKPVTAKETKEATDRLMWHEKKRLEKIQ